MVGLLPGIGGVRNHEPESEIVFFHDSVVKSDLLFEAQIFYQLDGTEDNFPSDFLAMQNFSIEPGLP